LEMLRGTAMNEILNINIKDNPPTQEALDQLRIQALNNLNVIKKLDKRLYYAFIILVSLGITSLMVIMFGMDNIVEAKFSSLDWNRGNTVHGE